MADARQPAGFRYRLPWLIAPGLGLDVVRGSPRSLARDCRTMVAHMQPTPRVIGVRTIPQTGPFVLVANHLEGPGLWIGWSAALLTHAVARARSASGRPPDVPIHWLAEADQDRGRVRGWKRLVPATGWAFRRVARVWGLVSLPRDGAPRMRRATALRRLVRLAAPPPAGEGEPVGFFPEGEGEGLAGLRRAPAAAGDLIALLARRGVPAVPAAVWLDGGRLTARISAPWLTDQRGAAATDEMMVRIGAMLPRAMWGAYAEAVAARAGIGSGTLS
jgi:hypothetical protein